MPIKVRFPNQADYACPRRITVERCDGPCAILDLGLTTFAKPFAITLLYGLICQLRQQGHAVRVVVPNDDVATYLWRMNLHRSFTDDPEVTFVPNLDRFSFKRWFQPKQLLELTVVDVANDDEVVAAQERFWSIIAERAPKYTALADQIRIALAELISNVQLHSGTGRATVIAQTYRDCVRIAVGDVGIGVRRSLERIHDLRGRADHEVLGFATEAGVTGSPFGGGTGLWSIVDAIRQNGRAVHLASGEGTYSVYRTRDDGRPSSLAVPGTIVEVVFDRPGS